MLNFDWASGISQESAKLVFYVLFILIGILVLLIPKDYVYEGVEEEDRHWWMNLKLWAITVLAFLFLTYLIF
jgi:hypothetical protein